MFAAEENAEFPAFPDGAVRRSRPAPSTFPGGGLVPYTPLDGNRTGPYAQWANYPAFAATAEIAGARNQITQEILQAYGLYPD